MMRAVCANCGNEQTIVLNYDIQTYPTLVYIHFEERCKRCHQQTMLVMPPRTDDNNVLDLMMPE